MGGVFNQYFAGRNRGHLVIIGIRPGFDGIKRAQCCGNDLAQVELHLLEQAIFVQVGLESLSIRQAQAGFAARLPAQRQAGGIPGRNGREHDQAGARLEAQTGDGFFRMGVFPGP